MRRISYRWQNDVLYTFLWSTAISFVINCIIQYAINGSLDLIATSILVSLIVFISTIFGGLQPIYTLRVIPDTIYLKNNQLAFKDGEILNVDDIEAVFVNRIGFSEWESLYYEINLKNTPNYISKRQRKSLIIVEPYKIKHYMQLREDFLGHLKMCGLENDKIKRTPQTFNSFLGFRNKLKK
jgi:hypothetical protein